MGTFAQVDTTTASVNNDTWTWSSANFGAAAADRYLIAVLTFNDVAVADSAVTYGVTIGGLAATIIFNDDDDAVDHTAGVIVAYVNVPTGTSGDVVLTITNFAGTMDTYGGALFAATGLLSGTPSSSPTGTANLAVTVPATGFGVFGAAAVGGASCGALSGTGVSTTYSGARGAAGYSTTPGAVTVDSSNADLFRGATWDFDTGQPAIRRGGGSPFMNGNPFRAPQHGRVFAPRAPVGYARRSSGLLLKKAA